MLLLIKRLVFLFSTLMPALFRSYFFKDYSFLINSLIKAGALWIKIGQWLSIRNDLLPEDLCNTLTRLQCNTNYHDPNYSQQVLNNSFNHTNLLSYFKKNPINSGSIAQIHSAKLKNGKSVIIKIVHPNVRQEMILDFSIINWFIKFLPSNIKPILKQFIQQTDLRNEARSLTIFRDSFKDIKNIKFPKLIFVNQNLIVMTKLPGVVQSSFLKKYPEYQKEVHTLKVVAYYKMVCQDHYIHGDFHPGNILCHVNKNKEIELGIIDPAPCIKIKKSRSALTDYFNQMVSVNPNKLCKLFIRCNTNKGADINMFKHKMLSLSGHSIGPNRKQFCTDELKTKIFTAVRESGMILEGDLSFLLISFFLVHYQIQNYRQIHLNAIKYILANNVFNIKMLVGNKFINYLSKNIPEILQNNKYGFNPDEHLNCKQEKFASNAFASSNEFASNAFASSNEFASNAFASSNEFTFNKKYSSHENNSSHENQFNINAKSFGFNNFQSAPKNFNIRNNSNVSTREKMYSFNTKFNNPEAKMMNPNNIKFAVKNIANLCMKYKPTLDEYYKQYKTNSNFKFYKTN